MNCKIVTTKDFYRDLKRLNKKYRSIKNDVAKISAVIRQNPEHGVLIRPNTRKVRVAVVSKGRGKSGGARLITYSVEEGIESYDAVVVFMALYDKYDLENLPDAEINSLILGIDIDSLL